MWIFLTGFQCLCLSIDEILDLLVTGPLDVSNCVATWNFGTNILQIFSKVKIFIRQQDQYGNLVPGLYAFDATVVEKNTNLSIPIADLIFEEVSPGIQLFSFGVLEPGNFILTIFDTKQNKNISNMPYDFTVFVGVSQDFCSHYLPLLILLILWKLSSILIFLFVFIIFPEYSDT